MADSIGRLLFKEKQLRLLMALSKTDREWHLAELAREAQVTYVHTSRFISKCEEMGIVATERHGKTKKLVLTEKGREVVDSLSVVIGKMSQAAQQAAPQQQAQPAVPKPVPMGPEVPV